MNIKKNIGIDLNGVLRNTLLRIEQVYEKWYIDNPFDIEDDDFEYEVMSPVTTLDIKSHLKFKDEDHLYDFLYKEYAMEIFGHAGSTEISGMIDLNDFYISMREENNILVVSDEIGKSKPATLFFLSKFGCLVETIKFYSEQTKNSLWESVDILLTANPDLLLNKPKEKLVIKYVTDYNRDIEVEHEINKFKELEEKIKSIYAESTR